MKDIDKDMSLPLYGNKKDKDSDMYMDMVMW
jgi:hypothetical protein